MLSLLKRSSSMRKEYFAMLSEKESMEWCAVPQFYFSYFLVSSCSIYIISRNDLSLFLEPLYFPFKMVLPFLSSYCLYC